jgi:60S ribosomal subunit assembly/export protein LOC1
LKDWRGARIRANNQQEETKKGLKKKKKGRHSDHTKFEGVDEFDDEKPEKKVQGKKKRVSFG